MKKILLFLFLVGIASNSYAASISVSSFTTPDDVTVAHLEQQRATFQDAINSADGALLQDGTITSAKLDDNANPEKRWDEGFNDFVYTGLLPPTSASLSSTTPSGTAYVNGVRVVKDATAKTYTASKWTFVDISDNGTYTYSEVALGGTEPSVATDSIRLARVSTDSTTVASVSDDRVTTITLAAGSVGSIADTDGDTQIQTEETSDEDKIRFDTGGTERMIIDDSGNVGIGTSTPTSLFSVGSSSEFQIDSSIQMFNTAQPCFLVHPASDQDDIASGSAVEVVFGTEVTDQGGDFASNTFTAPIDGNYLLTIFLYLQEMDSAATSYSFQITTSNRNYLVEIDPTTNFTADTNEEYFVSLSVIGDMDASDTASIDFTQAGGTNQVDIITQSHFSGALLN